MRPWHSSRNFLLGMTLALAGMSSACLGDGQPWGVLEAEMQARFAPSDGRFDDEGRLITSADYLIQLERLDVTFDAVTVVLGGAGAADFDPSAPPPGYSLCHNGHCHHESGELVDYEDIALELAGGSSGERVAVALDGAAWALGPDNVSVGVVPCDPSPCQLPRGKLVGLEVTVAAIDIKGVVFDRYEGGQDALPAEGWPFEASVPLKATLLEQIDGTIDAGEPVGVRVAIQFTLPQELFDQVDFGAAPPADAASWQSILVSTLEEHDAIDVVVSRF